MLLKFSILRVISPPLIQGLEGGVLVPHSRPFSRESRIPHVFHQFPESRFSFSEKYIKLINVRCRLILSIDILNLCVFSKASAKRNSFFFYLCMKRAGITICHI